jgi:hypothetical protein
VNVEHVREDPGENEDGDVIAGQTEGGKGEQRDIVGGGGDPIVLVSVLMYH